MVIRNFIVTFFLFIFVNITVTYQVISSDIDNAIESDTGASKSKKRKLDEVTPNQPSLNDALFDSVYEQAKSLLQQPTPQHMNFPQVTQKIETVDSFLKTLGGTYRHKVIDRMIQEYGADKLKINSGFVTLFLNERGKEPYTLQSLNDFKGAVRLGYKRFSYKPLSNDLGEVLVHLALARSLISRTWASSPQIPENQSFVFEIPTPLTGTAEEGQLANLGDSLLPELRFSSNCLDLSHTQLTPQLLREFAELQPKLHGKFSTLKFDQMNIADADFQTLQPVLFQRAFSSISCDGNQLTTSSLNWFLRMLQGEKKTNSPSTLSLRENNITGVNELVEVFIQSYAQQQERSLRPGYHVPVRAHNHEAREEPVKYNFSSLHTLDLSGNPFTKGAIEYLLQAFVKSPPQTTDYYSRSYPSVYPNTPSFFSETTIVLKEIASLEGSEQEIKDRLTKNPLMFKVILDDAFMPSK